MQDYARLWTLGVLLLMTMGCATLTFGRTDPAQQASEQIIAQVCQTFEPIRYSRLDTVETQTQVQAHNRAWDSLCKTSD